VSHLHSLAKSALVGNNATCT